jgi:hypothetical protein
VWCQPMPPPVSPEPPPSSLTGEWAGELLAANGAHAFQLSIDASGRMIGQLDDHPRAPILVPEWIDEELRGTIIADIGLDDLRQPYRLRIHLRRTTADRLAGPVRAWTFRSGRGADILPTCAVLHRKGASAAAADAR